MVHLTLSKPRAWRPVALRATKQPQLHVCRYQINPSRQIITDSNARQKRLEEASLGGDASKVVVEDYAPLETVDKLTEDVRTLLTEVAELKTLAGETGRTVAELKTLAVETGRTVAELKALAVEFKAQNEANKPKQEFNWNSIGVGAGMGVAMVVGTALKDRFWPK